MKPMHTLAVVTTAIALAVLPALPVLAQGDDAGPPPGRGPMAWSQRQGLGEQMHRRPMRGHMHFMGEHDPIARMLDNQTALRLTPAQVNSMIGIDDKLHADNKPLVERLMAMRRSRGRQYDERRGGAPDSSGMGSRAAAGDSVMAAMHTLRENTWRATAAADALLSADQLNAAGALDRPARGHIMTTIRPGGRPGMGPGRD